MCAFARSVLIAALLFVPVPSLHAQTAVDPSGHWEGVVQTPNTDVRIEIDLAKTKEGVITGSFGQPEQNLTGLPLANTAVDGTSVSFQIKGSAPGERVFRGVLSPNGTSMSGDFTQHGHSFPSSLTRTGDARIAAASKSPAISKQLEGAWTGTLSVNGTENPLVLTLSNQPDGTATASIVNTADRLEIPVATITERAARITLDIAAVGGAYTGVLNPEGTELAGTLTQGPAVMPLTFRRVAAGR